MANMRKAFGLFRVEESSSFSKKIETHDKNSVRNLVAIPEWGTAPRGVNIIAGTVAREAGIKPGLQYLSAQEVENTENDFVNWNWSYLMPVSETGLMDIMSKGEPVRLLMSDEEIAQQKEYAEAYSTSATVPEGEEV